MKRRTPETLWAKPQPTAEAVSDIAIVQAMRDFDGTALVRLQGELEAAFFGRSTEYPTIREFLAKITAGDVNP